MIRHESRPIKILADGTFLPATSKRTDHVAVLLPDEALIVHPYSLGTPSGEPLRNWDACAEACRSVRVLGFDDWELATRDDWKPNIDITRVSPAVDTNLYPGIKPSWHWTASGVAWGEKDAAGRSAAAWVVCAGSGDVFRYHRNGSGFALAVRRVGQ